MVDFHLTTLNVSIERDLRGTPLRPIGRKCIQNFGHIGKSMGIVTYPTDRRLTLNYQDGFPNKDKKEENVD